MAKRKLPNTKSSMKGKNVTNKITRDKIKKMLKHVSTDDFMKFNKDINSTASSSTNTAASITREKFKKSSKVNSISKKDKLRLKKQRFLNKIDRISADVKNGLLKKRNKKLQEPEKSVAPLNDTPPEDKAANTHNTIFQKAKTSLNANKVIVKSSCKSNKLSETSKIFKKAKNNSNKNRQRNFIKGLNIYKKQMKKEEFVEDPIKVISSRVNAYARKETAV